MSHIPPNLPQHPPPNAVSPREWFFVDNNRFPPSVTPFLIPRLNPLWQRLESTDLSVVYQPIIDMTSQSVIGYEGLIRGPDNTAHFLPYSLFALGRELDLTIELDLLCAQLVGRRGAGVGLPGVLCVNRSGESVLNR